MSFEVKPSEDLARGLRRVAAEQAGDAMHALRTAMAHPITEVDSSAEDPWDAGIHEVRKACKKVRGIARLSRDAMGRGYDHINAEFRDAARLLSDARDAWTLVEAFDGLPTLALDQEHGGSGTRDSDGALPVLGSKDGDAADLLSDSLLEERLPGLRAALFARYVDIRRRTDADDALARALAGLEAATADIRRWPLPTDLDGTALKPSIARVYGRGRVLWHKASKTIGHSPDDSTVTWHEWRKRTKYLRYQVDVLNLAWPGPLLALEDAMHDLSTHQGDDHDLAVLLEVVANDALLPPAALAQLAGGLAVIRHRVRGRAVGPASRIYTEDAEAFATRFSAYVDLTWSPA